MPPLCKLFTIVAMLLCCPPLPAQEQGDVAQLWQGYAELGMFDKLLTELETESRKGDSARESELIRTLLTYWEPIMNQRRLCNVNIHWDGDGVYGSISYRTQDMPPEMVQQRRALRIKANELSEEEQNQLIALFLSEKAYIAGAPDAEKIDRIIRHIHAEEYPQAIKQLAQLRQEHPDYCPQAFAELAAALDTPKRLELLLLCTRLPLGVIRETNKCVFPPSATKMQETRNKMLSTSVYLLENPDFLDFLLRIRGWEVLSYVKEIENDEKNLFNHIVLMACRWW